MRVALLLEVGVDALRTSSPILTDALQPAPEGSRLPARPVPVAHRTFALPLY